MKRIIDVVAALCGLVVFSPVILLFWALVRINMGSPAIYRQIRPGIHGHPFMIYKLRTMTDERDADGKLLAPEKRLTSLGEFMRAASIDELPQLWNLLKGDMSLVGPRPLLMDYLDRYSTEQARRHEVRPGITGWAQVNGRNALSWEDRFKLDVWYVDHQGLWLDFRILWLTLLKILRRESVTFPGDKVSDPFLGADREGANDNDENYLR